MGGNKANNVRKQKKSFVVSTLITLIIVAMLIFSGPASAVIVSISGLQGATIIQGNSKTFNITVTLENPDSYIPISNVSINITGGTSINATFDPVSGNRTMGDARISMATPIISPSDYYGGPGNRFGYDNYSGYGYGYGYNFDYGYGYGYNSGAGGGDVTFTYQVTLTTTSMATGSYSAIAHLNVNGNTSKPYFASSSASFTVTSSGCTSGCGGSSGGGGGGGGGGGASAENFSNILLKERSDAYVFKDKVAAFFFKLADPIVYVNITGNFNSGGVTTTVEVLKNTSTLVNNSAPGTVYKNINIWAGASGFNSPKNIKEGLIVFKILNSWMSDNKVNGKDVVMVKWDGSAWISLETKEVSKDDNHTYFEAKSNLFSTPFAITTTSGTTPGVTEPKPEVTPKETPKATATTPKSKTPGFEAIIALFAIVMLAVSLNKNRNRR